METPELRTARLLLRGWREPDREALARLSADPEVMRFFPAVLSRAESDALFERLRGALAARGFGLWAVEAPGVADFIGFVGLSEPNFEAGFTPCVEVGWRLAREHWGRGYATEAARAACRFGFERLGLGEIVSFTTAENWPSRRVMERLGMERDLHGDFYHPKLAADDPLRPHVLYRLQPSRLTP